MNAKNFNTQTVLTLLAAVFEMGYCAFKQLCLNFVTYSTRVLHSNVLTFLFSTHFVYLSSLLIKFITKLNYLILVIVRQPQANPMSIHKEIPSISSIMTGQYTFCDKLSVFFHFWIRSLFEFFQILRISAQISKILNKIKRFLDTTSLFELQFLYEYFNYSSQISLLNCPTILFSLL